MKQGCLRRRSLIRLAPAPGEQMEGEKKKFPLFPANYVTLQQLKERRMKEKQQREEDEEKEKRLEREKEEMRLQKEKEEEEAEERERRKKEEEKKEEEKKEEEKEKEKKMKKPMKSYEVGNYSSQNKGHDGRRIWARWEKEAQEKREVDNVDRVKKELEAQERREVDIVDRGKKERKQRKQKNRRKPAEDRAAAGVSPPTLTDNDIQLPIHLSDSSATTKSKSEGDRASHIASPAVTPSLEADKAVKSEASTEREREITRKLRDLRVITNETYENDSIVSETELSTAVVSEKGISTPEEDETQNIENSEANGSKTATTSGRKEFRSRSVAGKRGARGDRYLSRSSFKHQMIQHEKSRIWIPKEDLSGGSGGDQGQRDFTEDLSGRFNTSGELTYRRGITNRR